MGTMLLGRGRRALASVIASTVAAVLVGATPIGAQEQPRVRPSADAAVALVTRVIDGDTIDVEFPDGSRAAVRYIGIDTPEVYPEERREPFGLEATWANEGLVADRWVMLEQDVSETDRYGRLLRYVRVAVDDGWVFVNDELVRLGLAAVRAYPPDTRYHEHLLRTLESAVLAGAGMHADAADPFG